MRILALIVLMFFLAACGRDAPPAPVSVTPAGADTAPLAGSDPQVYFVNLQHGDVVSSPLRIVFGLSGKGVAPAGIDVEGTGHHHLLINTELDPDRLGEPIPADDQHVHFGGGQTEAVIELPTGEYTLQLVLGDAAHVPFSPSIESERITITVQ
ncbi:MAG: DUF4399 domain-containing protein [Gammaproteobacteria bacterium]|nr:DUF4399 domain-containing protein [Gammaproteobacteria bacterium]